MYPYSYVVTYSSTKFECRPLNCTVAVSLTSKDITVLVVGSTVDFEASPCVFSSGILLISSFLAQVGSGQIMGWGEKAIEVRNLQTGMLDSVFMHKRRQVFRFLCERNEKVSECICCLRYACRL